MVLLLIYAPFSRKKSSQRSRESVKSLTYEHTCFRLKTVWKHGNSGIHFYNDIKFNLIVPVGKKETHIVFAVVAQRLEIHAYNQRAAGSLLCATNDVW